MTHTAQKMKFFIKDFLGKSFLRIWSHLLKKSLTENFIFVQWYLLVIITRCFTCHEVSKYQKVSKYYDHDCSSDPRENLFWIEKLETILATIITSFNRTIILTGDTNIDVKKTLKSDNDIYKRLAILIFINFDLYLRNNKKQ